MSKRRSSLGRPNTNALRSAALTALMLVGGTGSAGCMNGQVSSKGEESSGKPAPAAPAGSAAPRAIRREYGSCLLSSTPGCEPNQPCTGPALHVDCPENLLEPGDPKPVTRRPPGKEDWLRVRPWLYFEAAKNRCAYTGESFCAPPGKFAQCTPAPAAVPVQCTKNAPAGTLDIPSFVYTDGLGACHKVPATTCKLNNRGLCDLPEGEIVPCSK
jgi:hypothetical protein